MARFIFLLAVLAAFFLPSHYSGVGETVLPEINLFHSKTCPHCLAEREFLAELKNQYPEIVINQYEVSEAQTPGKLRNFYAAYKVPSKEQGLVPITFIKDRYFLGFNENIGEEIENYIKNLIGDGDKTVSPPPAPSDVSKVNLSRKFNLPFIGEIDVSGFSPLALAAILGGLDGFNACAMLALGFLLAVLVATGRRERVFLIGGTFILVSGIVYFLFIATWFNLFLVLGQISFITFLVGLIVFLAAIFILRDYLRGVYCKLCKVEPGKKDIFARLEKNLFGRMEKIVGSKASLPLMLLGVAAVAAGVNLIELVCSFGFPLAFTKILASWNLAAPSYYFYLLVYIFFYMLDDFLIFLLTLWTLKVTGISQKYLKATTLVAGIFLLILGIVLMFRPELMVFS